MTNRVSVVVTGTSWMGAGIGSVETALERLFREAEQRLAIIAYSVSGSTDLLLHWLEATLARGVQIQIVINQLDAQPAGVVEYLTRLAGQYPHLEVFSFEADVDNDLHAKIAVADRRKAIVGSANLSRRGMVSKHELGLLVEGDAAESVSAAVDRLLSSRLVRRLSS